MHAEHARYGEAMAPDVGYVMVGDAVLGCLDEIRLDPSPVGRPAAKRRAAA